MDGQVMRTSWFRTGWQGIRVAVDTSKYLIGSRLTSQQRDGEHYYELASTLRSLSLSE